MTPVFRGMIHQSALCEPQRKQRSTVKSRFRGAVIAAVFAALAAVGCTQTGTGTTPSQTPLSPSSTTVPPSVTTPATAPMTSSATTPAVSPTQQPTEAGDIVPVHDPGQVTGTLTGPCHMTGTYPDQLPDRHCTPGSYDPAVTQANIHSTICVSGYTKTVRPPEAQTNSFKFNEAYPAYGIPVPQKTELDHDIALELGGSNDAKNLWPEPETSIPNNKDYVENAAHQAVCSGKMTLRAAQDAMATNWVALGQQLGVK